MKSIYQIYESIILEAMSLEEIFKKFYEKDLKSLEDLIKINDVDPTSSKDKKGKYLDWLVRKAYKTNPKRFFEDKNRIKEDLTIFDKNQRKIGKQIGQIKDYHELSKSVNEFREKKEKGEIDLSRSEIKKDTEKIFEDSEYLILTPKTKEAAKYYGAHTKWCTAANEDNRFDYYNKQGPLYIIIDKKNNKKYQFHFQTEQYMDEEDEYIEDYSTFPEIILDKIFELANKNERIVEFIDILKKSISVDKYKKIFSKEIDSYNLGLELIEYVETRNLAKVKELVDRGANIHAYDDHALRWASEKGHLEIVKFLIDKGANIHADDDAALRWASENDHLDVVKLLLDKGADIHAYTDNADLRDAAAPEIKKYIQDFIDKEKK